MSGGAATPIDLLGHSEGRSALPLQSLYAIEDLFDEYYHSLFSRVKRLP